MKESITVELFAALNILVMEQLDDGSFNIIGTVPEWFMHFHPDVASEWDKLMPGKKFPFMENFLIDAESFWRGNDAGTLKSGLWSETDISGNERYLEASAVRLNNKNILLISLGNATYEEKQFITQKGRENSLIYYDLVKEVQKKEILIHCIVHDLSGGITAINYCFQLLALQACHLKQGNTWKSA